MNLSALLYVFVMVLVYWWMFNVDGTLRNRNPEGWTSYDIDPFERWWWSLPRARCDGCGEGVITDERGEVLPHGCGRAT